VLHLLFSSVWDTFRGGAKPELGSMNLGVWSLSFELGSLEFDLLNLGLWSLIFEVTWTLWTWVFGIWCNLSACRKGVQFMRTAGIELWVQQYGCRNKSVSYPSQLVGLDQGLGFRLKEKQRRSKATWSCNQIKNQNQNQKEEWTNLEGSQIIVIVAIRVFFLPLFFFSSVQNAQF
jgi:hypothetical protein